MRYVVIAPEDLAHSQGDAGWGRLGAFVVMQENALNRLGGRAMGLSRPLPPQLIALGVDRPRVAFSQVITFDLNGDAIHVVHQPPAYSDADSVVHFHLANVIYLGEVFPGDGYPEIDSSLGGRLDGFIKMLVGGPIHRDRLFPFTARWLAAPTFEIFATRLWRFGTEYRRMIHDGQSESQIVAMRPTAQFDARWGHGRVSGGEFVRAVYHALARH